jgi:serine/threonine-protein phosphatase 2B catalytic subunit
VSELKSVSGSTKLPYGTLALGAEGIKDAISGFDDACVFSSYPLHLLPVSSRTHTRSRKSDIENERLPPDLVDADSEEGKAYMSQPQTPAEDALAPAPAASPNGLGAALEAAISSATSSSPSLTSGPPTPTSPAGGSPISPFRRGHGRQQSLGTTMTSPSTRRRSIESTMSLLKEAADGTERDAEFEQLADQVADGIKRDSVGTGRP